jgi:hypothetical protein
MWTWMRFSYPWQVPSDSFYDFESWNHAPSTAPPPNRALLERYVELRGAAYDPRTNRPGLEEAAARSIRVDSCASWVLLTDRAAADDAIGRKVVLTGRVLPAKGHAGAGYPFIVDTTASRFHGASIAGLVVGAMGVFVFTIALQHWLKERRKFREDARA